MIAPKRPGLFEAFGVELEYMIVDSATLDVYPAADKLLFSIAGEFASEIVRGPLAWSNELALHVIELKTAEPALMLRGLASQFQRGVREVNTLLKTMSARLMPTAMHPWMDPYRELQLWPHDVSVVYEAFNRIFDCRGHGWANLQSVHLNLPFGNDEEFGRLHAAIRLVLPILPAIAASSPMKDGELTGLLDTRLDVYRQNAARVPSVSGDVIPEPVFTSDDYQREILQRIYQDIAPLDPERILHHEWLNARGAIARFDRSTIEIRVLDVQECPEADLAVCALASSAVDMLVSEWLSDLDQQQLADTAMLRDILLQCIREGEKAVIKETDYLRLLGFREQASCTAGELWQFLWSEMMQGAKDLRSQFPGAEIILNQGPLARRILKQLGPNPSRSQREAVYASLCDHLAEGKMLS